jgi:hypothetical protein
MIFKNMKKDNYNNLINENSVASGKNEVVIPERLTKHQRYYRRKKEKFENLQKEAEAYKRETENYRSLFKFLSIIGAIFLFWCFKNKDLENEGRTTKLQSNTTNFQYQKTFRNSFGL